MNVCLYIGTPKDEWSRQFFPEKSPAELPVAGKTWVNHVVDICSLLEVPEVYVADCFYREALVSRLGGGALWSLNIHCLRSFPCATPEELLRRHAGAIDGSDELLFFWGLVLPDIQEPNEIFSELRPVGKPSGALPEGIYLLRGGELFECCCPLYRLDSLRSYFDLNFRLLDRPGVYNLPGYSTVNGCSIGMNVLIKLDCELERPVILQDNVCLERGAYLHNGVIVGREVLVDEGAELDHALILNHTYIGRKMLMKDKIVDGSRVIDVNTGAMEELEDEYLVGSTRRDPVDLCRVVGWLTALFFVVVTFPCYLLSLILPFLASKLAFFHMVHRVYPKCLRVLWGGGHLVRYGQGDTRYAFRYSDMWMLHQDRHLQELDDIYFYYRRSASLIVKVALVSLFKRLFVLTPPEYRLSGIEEEGK